MPDGSEGRAGEGLPPANDRRSDVARWQACPRGGRNLNRGSFSVDAKHTNRLQQLLYPEQALRITRTFQNTLNGVKFSIILEYEY
jgi:hypothetical protein